MRQVYLAATGRNHGKTTFALGLLAELIDRGHSTGFAKPMGQRYALVDEIPADEVKKLDVKMLIKIVRVRMVDGIEELENGKAAG